MTQHARLWVLATIVMSGSVSAQMVTSPRQPVPVITLPPTAKTIAKPMLPSDAPKTSSAPGQVSRDAPINGVLTLYGNERCPTDTNGNEVVVCVYRPAAEKYRIPKDLREFKVTPQNEAWAARLQPTMDAGATGVGSCSTVGANGATGCLAQQTELAKAEARERKKDATPDLKP